jgi:hypothetical protein
LLLLAEFFRRASGLVDHLLNRVVGVERRLIDLSTILVALVIGEDADCYFYSSFYLVGFGIH